MNLYDAHNHLQDARLDPVREDVMAEVGRQPIARMVVNGTREEDWPGVLALAKRHPVVLPSFGVHPWHVKDLSSDWKTILTRHLDQGPSGIGEIGLDRWIEGYDLPKQEEVFLWQLNCAAERNLPVTIHCLKAWGRLEALLRSAKRPGRGFLLHSYGGPAEMICSFTHLGAYFSISGHFAHERKARQREALKSVPWDRLLVETDAPDMELPEPWNRFPLADRITGAGTGAGTGRGKPINHPANLGSIYAFAATCLGRSEEELAGQVEQNFLRLFGGDMSAT